MTTPIHNLNQLIASMTPELHSGSYCFASLTGEHNIPLQSIIASIQEKEGLSVILEEKIAEKYQLDVQFKCAWITLTVHSDLAAVGLTAAFATALGQAGVSCNVVAGYYHDHIFIPFEQTDLAMATLLDLQNSYADSI